MPNHSPLSCQRPVSGGGISGVVTNTIMPVHSCHSEIRISSSSIQQTVQPSRLRSTTPPQRNQKTQHVRRNGFNKRRGVGKAIHSMTSRSSFFYGSNPQRYPHNNQPLFPSDKPTMQQLQSPSQKWTRCGTVYGGSRSDRCSNRIWKDGKRAESSDDTAIGVSDPTASLADRMTH